MAKCLSLYCCRIVVCSALLMSSLLDAVPHSPSVLGLPAHSTSQLSCTRDFVLHNTNCYRYFGHDLKRPFHPAEKVCSKFSSSLVSLHTIQEEAFVVQMAENNSAFWIGLSDEDEVHTLRKEGTFQWTSGEQLASYYNWKRGEPTNRRHLDCVKADHSGWSMAKGGCASSKLPFVCKKRACPYGLEWNGNSCTEPDREGEREGSRSYSTAASSLTHHHYQSSHVTTWLAASLLLVVVGVLCVVAMVTRCTAGRSTKLQRTEHVRTSSYTLSYRDNTHHHTRSTNRVQDLYPT